MEDHDVIIDTPHDYTVCKRRLGRFMQGGTVINDPQNTMYLDWDLL